jgi:hypothetical protein
MNIFVLDKNPTEAAKYHCDKHVVKMIVENAQLLSSAIHSLNMGEDKKIYKKTHFNHPCAIWCRESKENYEWTIEHGIALCNEYTKRFGGKIHKSMSVIMHSMTYDSFFKSSTLTPHAFAMPTKFRNLDDPIHSYRLYYAGSKFRFAKWRYGDPSWWGEYRALVKEQGLEVENDKDDGVK